VNIRDHNRQAWDKLGKQANQWTVPYGPEVIAAARRGEWEIYLAESTPVPKEWFPPLMGVDVLCLASGGGQQGPLLAAVGAKVTVYDNSPGQLAQDRLVADREGLLLTLVEGDMSDLGELGDATFDLIVHPVSNLFISEVRLVWQEAFRVLRPGGILMSGFLNPVQYIFDRTLADKGVFEVKYKLPYSDTTSLSPEEHAKAFGAESPLEFSHTLEDQIDGQLKAGFLLTRLYESKRRSDPLAEFFPSYIITRAWKPFPDALQNS
jgi:SAM-dependent methyltransferase